MASTYEKIEAKTLSSAASSVTFTGIPGTYTDLVLVTSIASSSSNTYFIRFNGDASALYSTTRLSGSGSSVYSDRDAPNSTYGVLSNYGYPSSTLGANITLCSVQDYSNATTFKTYLSKTGNTSTGQDHCVGLYRSSSAITSLSLSTNGFGISLTLLTGSVFTLYGIKAA